MTMLPVQKIGLSLLAACGIFQTGMGFYFLRLRPTLIAAINGHLVTGGMAVIATHVPMALAPMQQIRLGQVVQAEAQP